MAARGTQILTVFVATPGPAEGVRDVLRDLSAAELVGSYVWIDDTRVDAPGTRIPAVETDRGVDHVVALQDLLASRHYDLVRLCVLVPSGATAVPVRLETETMFADLLSSNSGGARSVRMRVLLRRPADAHAVSAVPALAGWHNLMVAPEDSRGPGMGHESLKLTTDPIDVGRQAAPVIAGITGLWTDDDHTPFDELPVLPGSSLRVVRSFYRRLDTSHAEHRLHSELLDFDGQLPLPRDAGTAVLYVDDVPTATRQMAQALWTKHGHLLTSARIPTPRKREPRHIRFRDALRMFGRFLAAVLTNAPSRLIGARRTGPRHRWPPRRNALCSVARRARTRSGRWGRCGRSSCRMGRVRIGVARDRCCARRRQERSARRSTRPVRAVARLFAGRADPGGCQRTISGTTTCPGGRAPRCAALGVGHRARPGRGFHRHPGRGVRNHVDARHRSTRHPRGRRIRPPTAGTRTGSGDRVGRAPHRRRDQELARAHPASFAVGFGSILTDRLAADVSEAGRLLERLKSAEALRDPAEESAEVHKRMFARCTSQVWLRW